MRLVFKRFLKTRSKSNKQLVNKCFIIIVIIV
jgi:hypothetical protein